MNKLVDSRGKIGFVACKSGLPFAEKVAKGLNEKFSKESSSWEPNSIHEHNLNNGFIRPTEEKQFANGELLTSLGESIRHQDAYIFADVTNPTERGYSLNDNIMALESAIDAVRRADTHYITVVLPYFPYSRQDKLHGRESLMAKRLVKNIEDAGATRVLTLDIHNKSISGFFDKTILENLQASKTMMTYISEKQYGNNLIVVAPDAGAGERNEYYANKLGTDLAFIWKKRDKKIVNTIEKLVVVGDVSGKNVLSVDDMIDTAGTMVQGCTAIKEADALDITFATSLPFFNGEAINRINKAYQDKIIKRIIGTDAVYKSDDFKKNNPWYEEVSVAKYFAKVIFNINTTQSVSELLK